MADIVTGTVTGQVDVTSLLVGQADIRRENAYEAATLRQEVAKEASDTNANVKQAGWNVTDRINSSTDRVTDQDTAYFIAGQQINFQNATALAALKAGTDSNFNQTLAAIQLAASQTTAAAVLAGEKTAAAAALGQALIGQQIVQDGMVTRALMNSQTVDALRFAKLEEKFEHRHDHGHRGCGEREEGRITYGPPVSATYPA